MEGKRDNSPNQMTMSSPPTSNNKSGSGGRMDPPRVSSGGGGSSSGKKKRKSGRRRRDNEIYKATDGIVNSRRQLTSVVFQRDSKIVKMPHDNSAQSMQPRLPFAQGQFDSAPEMADLAQLRQYHPTSVSSGNMAHPPFGYFSLHPTSLSLHPQSAVHLYYPMAPMVNNIIGSSNKANSNNNNNNNNNATTNHNNNGFGLGFPQSAFGAPGTAAAGMNPSAMSSFYNPFMFPGMTGMNSGASGMAPGASALSAQNAMTGMNSGASGMTPSASALSAQNAMKGMAGMTPQQQYAAIMKQMDLQEQEKIAKAKERFKLQQEVELKEKHLKALEEKQAVIRLQMNNATNPTMTQQQQSKMSASQLQARDQMFVEQKKQAAFAMAAMSQQQPAAATAAALDKSQQVNPRERTTSIDKGASDQDGPVSAIMALAAARGYTKEDQRKQQMLAAMSGMAGVMKQPKAQRSPTEQHTSSVRGINSDVLKGAVKVLPGGMAARSNLGPTESQDTTDEYSSIASGRNLNGINGMRRPIMTAGQGALTTGMEQLETLPMGAATQPDTKKKHPVRETQITECDVLLGRGGMTNHHVGNMHFRTLVSNFRPHYADAKKGEKGMLSKKLTNFVRFKKGRFLQKDEGDNCWYEVGDKRAHGKCAQALREGTTEMRQVSDGVLYTYTEPHRYGHTLLGPRPSSALTTSSSDSDSPDPPATMNGYSDSAQGTTPRGGIMAGANSIQHGTGMQQSTAMKSQISPRCVVVSQQSVVKSPQMNGGSPSPKRPLSETRKQHHGIRPTDEESEPYSEEKMMATDAPGRSEVSEDHQSDHSDSTEEEDHGITEEEARRKRVKIDDGEGEDQEYDYM